MDVRPDSELDARLFCDGAAFFDFFVSDDVNDGHNGADTFFFAAYRKTKHGNLVMGVRLKGDGSGVEEEFLN